MNYLWAGMMLVAIICGSVNGTIPEVTQAALDSSKEAVTLCITMLGILSFWMGLMQIGTASGLIEKMTRGIRPVLQWLFPEIPKHFINRMKQHGALLAKGRLLGIQFDTLFTDHLYMDISRHAIDMAELLKKGLKEKGYSFYLESPTNQQFIILEDEEMERLKKYVTFSFWEKPDNDHTVVRFATSWATSEEDIEQLMELL